MLNGPGRGADGGRKDVAVEMRCRNLATIRSGSRSEASSSPGHWLHVVQKDRAPNSKILSSKVMLLPLYCILEQSTSSQ